jgi:hypothetical protein
MICLLLESVNHRHDFFRRDKLAIHAMYTDNAPPTRNGLDLALIVA